MTRALLIITFLLAGATGGALASAHRGWTKARALETELNEALRQMQARDEALAAYATRRAQEEAATQARQSELEQEIARYEKALADAGRACRLDDGDVDWLRD